MNVAFREDLCGCCFKTEENTDENPRLKRVRKLSVIFNESNFCGTSFIPECIRPMIKENEEAIQFARNNPKPYRKTFPAIVMVIEIPAIVEVIDFYSVSINFTVQEIGEVLDTYLSRIMTLVKVGEGDVIHYEGEKFLCLWPVLENTRELTRQVLHVALTIQGEMGSFETKLGRPFRSLIGMSVGEVDVFFVGSAKVFYPVIGNAVQDAFCAASQCGKSEVVVNTQVWKTLASTEEYQFQTLSEEYVTVFSTTELMKFDESVLEAMEISMSSFEEEYGKVLNSFIHPVPDNTKLHQQLQMLSSMGQIVAVAISVRNVDLNTHDEMHELIEVIREIVHTQGGIIRNIVHHPNLTFLMFFGFPEFRNIDDPVRAVVASRDIYQNLKGKGYDLTVAISSSTVFIGMIGPTIRKIRCVCGMAMSVAWNMVGYFSDVDIVCCANTFFLTRRAFGDIFVPIQKSSKTLKSTFSSAFFKVQFDPFVDQLSWKKIIGRVKEKEEILDTFKRLKKELPKLEKKFPLVVLSGEFGIGKSLMLKWFHSEVHKIGFPISSYIHFDRAEEPFESAWQVLKDVLTQSKNDSHDKILDLVGNKADEFPLHLLNKLFKTSFEPPRRRLGETEARKMVFTLIQEISKECDLVVFIDNIAPIGPESWLLLADLLITHSAALVVSVIDGFGPVVDIPFLGHVMRESYHTIKIQRLSAKEIAALACELLGVSAINTYLANFLYKHSLGVPLRLQEILCIPQLKRHLHVVPLTSFSDTGLRKNFLMFDVDSKPPEKSFICDAIELETMKTMSIPKDLLDIIRDHSLALSAEEMMIVRKCALLGNTFSIHTLESVCPEYPIEELRCKVYDLLQKNILTLECDHLQVSEIGKRPMVVQSRITLYFCPHPLRFSCSAMRRITLSLMGEAQKERLNLYLAQLLEELVLCDSCKWEAEVPRTLMYAKFARSNRVPFIDIRLCQCKNLNARMSLQLEYHLERGNGQLNDRLNVLMEAGTLALKAKMPLLVEKIINKLKSLCFGVSDSMTDLLPNPYKVGINRLEAELDHMLGKYQEALTNIKHALLLMNIMFPADLRKKVYQKNKYEGLLLMEEKKCLFIGCLILAKIGAYEIARTVGRVQLDILLKTGHSFCEVVKSHAVLLLATARTKPCKTREENCKSLIAGIKKYCSKRLDEFPVMDVDELESIMLAYKNSIIVLGEKNKLEEAEHLGLKCYQLLKLTKNMKGLGRILMALAIIYFQAGNYEKCFEMVCQLQDAFKQSGDPISEYHFYCVLITLLRNSIYRVYHQDKTNVCIDYALQFPRLTSHSKYTDRLFQLSANMALWSFELEKFEASKKWDFRAMEYYPKVHLNNYFALQGSIVMLILQMQKIKANSEYLINEEMADLKMSIDQKLTKVSKAVEDYVPLLQEEVDNMKKLFTRILSKKE